MLRYRCQLRASEEPVSGLCCREKFPLYISQDGPIPNPRVAELAKHLAKDGINYMHHKEDKPPEPMTTKKENLAYYRISNHYKFLMRTFFECFGYNKLIILEASHPHSMACFGDLPAMMHAYCIHACIDENIDQRRVNHGTY